MKKIEFEIELPDFGFGKKKKKEQKRERGKSGKWRRIWDKADFIFWPAVSWGIPLALMFFFDLALSEILILGYFIFVLLRRIESRLSAGLALFFLILCPILLQLKENALAEEFAVYAFYFLSITVIQQIQELALENFSRKNDSFFSAVASEISDKLRRKKRLGKKIVPRFFAEMFRWLGNFFFVFLAIGIIFLGMNYYFEIEFGRTITAVFSFVFLASLVSASYFKMFARERNI